MSYGIKPFVVIKKIGDYNGTVVREFEQIEPAAVFASLLNSSEEKEFIKYYVADVRIPNEVVSSPAATQLMFDACPADVIVHLRLAPAPPQPHKRNSLFILQLAHQSDFNY